MVKSSLFESRQSYRVALPVMVMVYLASQMPAARAMLSTGAGLTTDDAMRLVQVRDLLAGQAWYDLFQHRVLPPDGLSMHWSRYIDAPMALIMAALQPFFGPDMAARLVAVLWPLMLGVVFILATAALTKRLYGRQAAFLSLLVIPSYEFLAGSGFGVGSTDHHAVQILLMLGLFAMTVLPGRPLLRGVAGGALAALSLAVGLEMILFIGLAGVLMVLGFVLGHDGANRRLGGFSAALAGATPLLMAGQLDPALWGVPVCDAISPPLLALTTCAFVASVVLLLTGRFVQPPLARAAVTLAVGVGAALVLLPVIQPCLAGPYTAMSAEIQKTVLSRIQEIKPAGFYFATDGGRVISLLLPIYAITLLFAAAVLAERGRGFVLLAFLAMGAALSFWQLRMLTMGLPVVAIAFGAGAGWALSHKNVAVKLGGVAVILGVLLSRPLAISYITFSWDGPGKPLAKAAMSERCNDLDQMAVLRSVPAGIVFNPINLGPIILLGSPQSVTSAPYHRSADAFVNGILPFEGDEAGLRAAVERTRADYILFCKGDVYGTKDSIGTALAKGEMRPWLTGVPLQGSNLLLLRVLR